MPRVTRRRTIAAPVAEVWALVSDPYSLPRWWPRTTRVENVERKSGGRRSQWTKVLETAEGRGVRADFRCLSSAEGERYVWEQQLEGTPFERHLRSSAVEIAPARSGEGGTEVSLGVQAGAARPLAARLADDAPRPGGDPRRSARRDREGARRDRAAPRLEVVGVGRSRDRAASWTRRRWRCCGSGSASWSPRRGAGELDGFAAARRPSRCRAALLDAVGEEDVFTGVEDRVRHATGRGYADLARLRCGRLDAAPDAVAAAGRRRRRCAGCSTPAPARASPSSPSAAAPASSAGSSRCAAPTTASSASTWPRLRGVEVDRRSLTARLGAGLRGPEAEAALGAAGPRPRPLPAVLRVRDDRRLRRHPLRRAGLERLRALRRAGQRGPPARSGR